MPTPSAGRALVKICGITRAEDARRAAELDVDMVGLNFHPGSPRFLELDRAARIADAVRGRVALVGVFVNRPPEEVSTIADRLGLDLVQFHGDEDPAEVASFGERALKVLRVGGRDPRPERLAGYPSVWGFLFDVADTDRFGGTGRQWAYERVAGLAPERPRLVAGGIRPETAAAALAASGATGIDICSGVEAAPGVKDWAAMESLMDEVRRG